MSFPGKAFIIWSVIITLVVIWAVPKVKAAISKQTAPAA